jgi:hypothetical protein
MTRDNYSIIILLTISCTFCVGVVGNLYGRFLEQREAIKAGVGCWYTDGDSKPAKFQYLKLTN